MSGLEHGAVAGSAATAPATPENWRPILPVPDGVTLEIPGARRSAPAQLWRYKDASGRLLGAVCRWDTPKGKRILPLTYCENAEGERTWRFKQFPEPRPLYRLDDLAARATATVLVCEGEKTADAADALFTNVVATTSPGGANAAGKAGWSPLAGRDVVIWLDNDELGAGYAEAVARLAHGAGARSVRVVKIPAGFPDHWDLADPLPEGLAVDDLRALLHAAEAREPPLSPSKMQRRDGPGVFSVRDELIDIAEATATFWHDPDFVPFASVARDGHIENAPIDSDAFRLALVAAYGIAHPRRRRDGTLAPAGVGDAALKEAMVALTAVARSGPTHEPKVRLAGADGRLYVDLGSEAWSSVEIDATGWRIVPQAPVKFIRPPGFRPLPEPVRGGQLSELRPFFNVGNDEDYAVLCAFLITSLRPSGPYWLLALSGEQGSGKSVLSKAIRALVDPNAAPARAPAKDEEVLVLAACNGWLLAYDNVSRLSGDLSDALCRLATGGGFGRRKLQTHGEWLSDVCRPVLLNGIPELTNRADLGDRALALSLPPIGSRKRQTEAEFWEAFEQARPRILGALYDAAAMGLRRQGDLQLSRFPRMPDAARFACAAAPALGLNEDEMLVILERNARVTAAVSLESWVLLQPLLSLLDQSYGTWSGTPTQLLTELGTRAPNGATRSKSWPCDATRLGGQLRRHAPPLRQIGVTIAWDRSARSRTIIIKRFEGQDRDEGDGPP